MLLRPSRPEDAIRGHGFDVDITMTFPTPVLANVFYGLDTWQRPTRAGDITIDGPPRLIKAVPTWFGLSPFAPLLRTQTPRKLHSAG